MRVTLLLLPGLDLPSLHGHDWPQLGTRLEEGRVARLASARFPARPEDLDATLAASLGASGAVDAHGVAWVHPAGELPPAPLEADLERLRAPGPGEGELQLLRLPSLAAAMARSGLGGDETQRTRAALDEALAGRLATCNDGQVVWATGLAPFAPRRASFDATGEDVLGAGGCVVRLDPSTADAPGRWLGRPGAERLLEGEGLELFGGAGGRWLLLEPGWSASGGEVVAGHPADPEGRAPALLAAGGPPGKPWPATVHFSRVAPTLLAALGRDLPGGADRPLAGP